MITEEQKRLFAEKLRLRLTSLGFPPSAAEKATSSLLPSHLDGNTLVAECHDGFYREEVFQSQLPELNQVARECWGPEIEVRIRHEAPTTTTQRKVRGKGKSAQTTSLESFFEPQVQTSPAEPPRAAVTQEEPAEEDGFSPNSDFEKPGNRLNPQFTFSTFVRGQSNALAYSACESVTRNPGELTNPVFIYGATGLGKTHLLHSVGNDILRRHPDWTILYVTSEEFMTDMITSIRCHRQAAFRQKYRSADVLLVDDIQFLENREATQLEFFFTFNELCQKRKQIVITSDKYPKDIPNIEERLKSRFLQGLIADIEPPSYEDRYAIIEAKAKPMSLKLKPEIIHHIATHAKTNVREIEGLLNNLRIRQLMTGKIPSLDCVNEYLKRIIRLDNPKLDVSSIQRAVATHFNIRLSDLLSATRERRIVQPRQIAMFLTREILGTSLEEIARSFGKRDHTTIMNAIEKIEDLAKKDASCRAAIMEIRRKLEQHLP